MLHLASALLMFTGIYYADDATWPAVVLNHHSEL